MNALSQLSAYELIALANVFAIAFSEGLSSDEISKVSSFFNAIGDNMGIIAGDIASKS